MKKETAREESEKLSKIIQSKKFNEYGNIEELKKVYRLHRPDRLWDAPDTPETRGKIGEFLNELRELHEALQHRRFEDDAKIRSAEARVVESEEKEKRKQQLREKKQRDREFAGLAVVGPARVDLSGSKAARRSESERTPTGDPAGTHFGSYEGFKYKIVPRNDGTWSVKLRYREILPTQGAPDIYQSPSLHKTHKRLLDAEEAITRDIRHVLIWYAERGKTMQFALRKTQQLLGRIGSSRQRRRPEGKEELAARTKSALDILRSHEVARREKESVITGSKPRRTKEESTGKKKRYFEFVPKKTSKNPSVLSFLGMGKGKAKPSEDRAKEFFEKFQQSKKAFDDSATAGKPNFKKLLNAYDYIELCRVNAFLAADKAGTDKFKKIKSELRNDIIYNLDLCQNYLNTVGGREDNPKSRSKNPNKEEHMKIGLDHLEKAESSWKKYCDTCGVMDLLATYKMAERSRDELKHAGDKEKCARANELSQLAKSEIKKRIKGS